MSNILEVKDLCKTYIINKRQNNVLKNVSFSISEGEMVAIMDRRARASQPCCITYPEWIVLRRAVLDFAETNFQALQKASFQT